MAFRRRPFLDLAAMNMADAVNSQMILLWGGNGADTRLVDFHFVMAAQQRGAKLVCIDPNRSATAQRADQWISPRPGTDTALALALLNEILQNGWQDDDFPRRHTNAAFLVRRDNGRFVARGGHHSPAMLRIIWSGIRPVIALPRPPTVQCASAAQATIE